MTTRLKQHTGYPVGSCRRGCRTSCAPY